MTMTSYTHTQLQAVLRQDLTTFTEKSFKAVNPGATYRRSCHIEGIAHALEQCHRREIRRLAIAVSPRSMKSICASVGGHSEVHLAIRSGGAMERRYARSSILRLCGQLSHRRKGRHHHGRRGLTRHPPSGGRCREDDDR